MATCVLFSNSSFPSPILSCPFLPWSPVPPLSLETQHKPGYTKRLKTQRGKVSLLFLGNDSPAPGALIKLDHGKKKVK